jgi:cell division protein FtsZ
MNNAFELVDTYQKNVVIKIISMNESSDDAVRNIEKQLDGMDFIYFDAIENGANLREILNGVDMVFLICATNDSKLNDIADITLELKILTIAVVTKPIPLDASKNITQLLCHVDEGKTLNDVLLESVQGITGCVIHPGFINLDFSDVEQVLSGESRAIISVNFATGENRASNATKQALASPLFREADLKNARAVLVNISASDMGLAEFNEVGDVILEQASKNASVKIGMSVKPDLGEAISIVIVFAGV